MQNQPKGELEVVEQDDPILAHRSAYLKPGRRGLRLTSVNQGTILKLDMDSYCLHHPKGPVPDCMCGFYALPSDVFNDQWRTGSGTGLVDLEVELSGDIIDCERMYRAGHQRILSVRLPVCMFCGQSTEVLWFDEGGVVAMGCASHYATPAPGWHAVTVEQLSEVLGVPVTDEPDWPEQDRPRYIS
jgi:hypothetical protein